MKQFLPCLGMPGDNSDFPLCIFSLSSVIKKNVLIRVFSHLYTKIGLLGKIVWPFVCFLRKQEYDHLL